jgi:hypothetical protein
MGDEDNTARDFFLLRDPIMKLNCLGVECSVRGTEKRGLLHPLRNSHDDEEPSASTLGWLLLLGEGKRLV